MGVTSVHVFEADCLRVGEYLEPESIAAVVSDPPYGLSFMGHGWDAEVPGPAYWRAFLGVARPGALLLACGGTRTWHREACAVEDGGWEIIDSLAWLYGQGFPKAKSRLKPFYEPIVLARKPGPIRDLNIDACRIPADRKGGHTKKTARDQTRKSGVALSMSAGDPCDGLGRWPANVVCDEEAASALDGQTGILTSGSSAGFLGEVERSVALGRKRAMIRPEAIYADSGGASRFLYTAKASKSERTHNGAVENLHSTVKPLNLMRWLVRLITPAGGVVLDPFCGSGTTLCASILEGFDVIGFENDPKSAATARARVAATQKPLSVA